MILRREFRAVVAAAIGHHQRPLVMDTHEAGQVAAGRAVQSLWPAGGENGEGRRLDEACDSVA